MNSSVKPATRETVTCAYCRGTGHGSPWNRRSPSLCSACGGRGTQAIQPPIRACAHCGGTGVHPHSRVTCTTCRGAGAVHVAADAGPCPRCAGRGVDPDSQLDLACLQCGGSGWRSA